MRSFGRRVYPYGREVIMPRAVNSRHKGAILAWALVLFVVYAIPGVAAMSAREWDACRDRVVATLEAKGLRDFGDVSAYTGATGTGALHAVIEQCGYRSERIDRAFCDDLYEQVYPACRADGFEGMSMSATSWVLIFNPEGHLVNRLREVCAQPQTVGRAVFGRLVCNE
jgi:hypothetical protein